MATSPGQRFVRRHNAARGSTANGTAADISYDTAVLSEGGYTWSSPEATVDEAGLYLCIYDIGEVQTASTRAVGTLVPSVNTTDQTTFRAGHRYLRNSGGNHNTSFGVCILDLSASDDVKVRNPGALAPTDAVGNYATNAGQGGGFQLIRLNAGNFTQVRRTSDAAECGISNINTTRPWLDSSGTWTTITYNSEDRDDDGLYSGSGGDLTLKANTKYMVVWGGNCYSTDSSRHSYVARLQINGNNVQAGYGYQRTTASQGPPWQGIYLHETGGSTETLRVQATQETEGADAGTPQVADAYVQILELPSSAEWIHVDNGATDSLTTALAGTSTYYDTPLSSTVRADGDSNLSLDGTNDAVQNDSGGSLPVLAIGWHRWDRDSGSSGTRKHCWTYWDNGGTRLAYANSGGYNRGQQSGDDTFQLSYVNAATMDLANGADLSFQVRDPQSGSNADMGIYASTSRYFLGVQVLNLDTLDAGSPPASVTPTDTSQTQASDTADLTQNYSVTATETSQAQVSDTTGLTVEYSVVLTETSQAQSSDTVAVSSGISVTPDETAQAQVSDTVSLTHSYTVGLLETDQSQTSGDTSVSSGVAVALDESNQAQQSDVSSVSPHARTGGVSPYLIQRRGRVGRVFSPFERYTAPVSVTPTETAQAQASDTTTVSVEYSDTASETAQAQESGTPLAGVEYSLTATETLQAQASDALIITTGVGIGLSSTFQGQASDTTNLLESASVSATETSQTQASDTTSLTGSASLTPTETAQAQVSDTTSLTEAASVTATDSAQAQASDSAFLTLAGSITPFNTSQAQTSIDAVVSSPVDPAGSSQQHASDTATLVVNFSLSADGSAQAQASDTTTLVENIPVALTGTTQLQAANDATITEAASVVALHTAQQQESGVASYLYIPLLTPPGSTQAQVSDTTFIIPPGFAVALDSAQVQASDLCVADGNTAREFVLSQIGQSRWTDIGRNFNTPLEDQE